jgi:hypothetical protein
MDNSFVWRPSMKYCHCEICTGPEPQDEDPTEEEQAEDELMKQEEAARDAAEEQEPN